LILGFKILPFTSILQGAHQFQVLLKVTSAITQSKATQSSVSRLTQPFLQYSQALLLVVNP